MNEVERNLKEVLEYIRDNPGCNSNSLDVRLVHELVTSGLATGVNIFSSSTTVQIETELEYESLYVSVNGENYLLQTALPINRYEGWRKSPIILAFITIVGTVTAAGIIYALGWQ